MTYNTVFDSDDCLCRMCLAAHPEKQAKLAHELQQHGLLATPENPHPRQVTADDLPKLHYTDAVCCPLLKALHEWSIFASTECTAVQLVWLVRLCSICTCAAGQQ